MSTVLFVEADGEGCLCMELIVVLRPWQRVLCLLTGKVPVTVARWGLTRHTVCFSADLGHSSD